MTNKNDNIIFQLFFAIANLVFVFSILLLDIYVSPDFNVNFEIVNSEANNYICHFVQENVMM